VQTLSFNTSTAKQKTKNKTNKTCEKVKEKKADKEQRIQSMRAIGYNSVTKQAQHG
jgi:hypothetical protein